MTKKLKRLFHPVLILGFTLFLLIPLFSKQLLYTDDAQFHAARIANYYLAAKQGQIPPRLAPNLDSGYGSPVLNFAYPLPYIIGTLIYMALPTMIATSLNLTTILLITCGTLGIYYLARKFSLSEWHSTLAAIVYLTAPYSLINIYSRTALGEITFFAVIPWVMWGVESFIRDKKVRPIVSLILAISLVSLLLSHQTSVMISAPMLTIYYWIRIKNKENKFALIKRITPIIAISLLLSAWYILPALLEKQFIILDRADTVTNYLDQFPTHWSLLFHKITNLERLDVLKIVSIGYSNLLIILVGWWSIIKNKIKNKKAIMYLLLMFSLTIIMMIPFTRPLWLISGIGHYIQYPWRLLFFVTLSSTLLFIHLNKEKLIPNSILKLIFITCLVSAFTYAQPRGFQSWSDYELFEYFGTTTTFNEFQPIWAAEYTKNFPAEKISFRKPQQQLYDDEVLKTAEYAQLEVESWHGSIMKYKVRTEQTVEVIQKTYYFPGWELTIDGEKQSIQYQDEEFPGHITYSLEPGKHQIQLEFTQNTPARRIGAIAFFIGLVSLVLYLNLSKINKLLHLR